MMPRSHNFHPSIHPTIAPHSFAVSSPPPLLSFPLWRFRISGKEEEEEEEETAPGLTNPNRPLLLPIPNISSAPG